MVELDFLLEITLAVGYKIVWLNYKFLVGNAKGHRHVVLAHHRVEQEGVHVILHHIFHHVIREDHVIEGGVDLDLVQKMLIGLLEQGIAFLG